MENKLFDTLSDGRVVLYKNTIKEYSKDKQKITEINNEPLEQVLEPYGPEWLYSLNFKEGDVRQVGEYLELNLYQVENLIRFTDRPYRLWSPVSNQQLVNLWLRSNDFYTQSNDFYTQSNDFYTQSNDFYTQSNDFYTQSNDFYTQSNDFYIDNPNAVLNLDGNNYVIELHDCKSIDNELIFKIKMLSETVIPKTFSQGSLFIDAKKCEITGKKPMNGNNRTKRRFLPNLQKIKYISENKSKNVKLKISGLELRKLEKDKNGDTPEVRGMINKIQHVVNVVKVDPLP
ncbi:Ribosomal L28 family [seawater metagenome]|uniref:Ribosomal L28 family n=1 Tax=seawater metagenome TaxID=1561972 RepID=A0A5E8CI88_9ZZZZ